MIKKSANDEIDLIETFILLWKKKITIILILIITLLLTFSLNLTKEPTDTRVIITSEIRPITVYDEAKYRIYNSFLSTLKPNYLRSLKPSPSENFLLFEKNTGKKINNFEMENTYMEGLVVNNISKSFLYDLFIDRLNQRSYLINALKRSNIIKREKYSNNLLYEDAILNLVSSIQIINLDSKKPILDNKSSIIQIDTSFDLSENWENFLKFIEKETNILIQSDLSEMINNYLEYSKKLKIFAIEDIDIELLGSSTDEDSRKLLKMKESIVAEKYTERMQNVFATSPIADSESFYAARIIYDASSYETVGEDNLSIKRMLIIGGVFGLIFGILFVLLRNAIQQRR